MMWMLYLGSFLFVLGLMGVVMFGLEVLAGDAP